jgi:diguanylate cyclase (GGDEF)-like protein
VAHNILYVDDEPQNLDAFARAFFDADYVGEVFTAGSAEEGLKVLAEKPVAAIVSDQRMPGMKGTEFLAKAYARDPEPVRLILTGYTDVKDILAAINEAHIYSYITKPWEVGELQLAVRRALEHYETVQELRAKRRELEHAYASLEQAHEEQVRLYEMAITDEKTGVRNYHFFRIRLGEELARARRYHSELSVILVDIDDFKKLNDVHGHMFGDTALQAIAQLLVEGQRAADVVARWGGEEFAVILPECASGDARAIADRMRQRVAAHGFVGQGGAELHLTISCGVSTYPHPSIGTKEELIERADKALYAAKGAGKNRVAVAE